MQMGSCMMTQGSSSWGRGFCKVIVSETATQNWIMTAQKANCRHQCLPPEGSRPWIDLEVPVIGALDAMNAIFLRLSS